MVFNKNKLIYEMYNDDSVPRIESLDMNLPFLKTKDIQIMFGGQNKD